MLLDSNDELPIKNISTDLRQRNLVYDIVTGYKIKAPGDQLQTRFCIYNIREAKETNKRPIL